MKLLKKQRTLKEWLTPGLYQPYSSESRVMLDRAIDWGVIEGYFKRDAYVEMEQYIHKLVIEGHNAIIKKSLGHD